MTSFRVRSDPTSELPQDDSVLVLDWEPGRPSATIQIGRQAGARFFDGWRAPREALDLFMLGAAAYCVDKTSMRRSVPDHWTRELHVELPVGSTGRWDNSAVEPVLDFLTGDRWSIRSYHEPRSPLAGLERVPEGVTPVAEVDGVCLFSGGLDSLTGVIDLLEEDPDRKLCLLSHNEGDKASTAQQELLAKLRDHYGKERLQDRRLFLRPAPINRHQARPLPSGRENTTRARSLLFLTAALALASSISPTTPVYIPENGFIGINVPLTRARSGSYSTRTTHPFFIKSLNSAIRDLGVHNPIVNPFRLKTKGQILAETKNPKLLERLAPLSISCSHPEAARYVKRPQGNCGYCFPCIIRRASMAHVGWDGAAGYSWDALSGTDLLDRNTRRASDLRAVIAGVYAERPDRDILRNGPIPDGEHKEFLRVWRTGLEELRDWLNDATGATNALVSRRR